MSTTDANDTNISSSNPNLNRGFPGLVICGEEGVPDIYSTNYAENYNWKSSTKCILPRPTDEDYLNCVSSGNTYNLAKCPEGYMTTVFNDRFVCDGVVNTFNKCDINPSDPYWEKIDPSLSTYLDPKKYLKGYFDITELYGESVKENYLLSLVDNKSVAIKMHGIEFPYPNSKQMYTIKGALNNSNFIENFDTLTTKLNDTQNNMLQQALKCCNGSISDPTSNEAIRCGSYYMNNTKPGFSDNESSCTYLQDKICKNPKYAFTSGCIEYYKKNLLNAKDATQIGNIKSDIRKICSTGSVNTHGAFSTELHKSKYPDAIDKSAKFDKVDVSSNANPNTDYMDLRFPNTYPEGVDPYQWQELCGCFLPSDYYSEYWKGLSKVKPGNDTTQGTSIAFETAECWYPYCINSSLNMLKTLNPDGTAYTYPKCNIDLQVCINKTDIKANSIATSTINSVGNCYFNNSDLPSDSPGAEGGADAKEAAAKAAKEKADAERAAETNSKSPISKWINNNVEIFILLVCICLIFGGLGLYWIVKLFKPPASQVHPLHVSIPILSAAAS